MTDPTQNRSTHTILHRMVRSVNLAFVISIIIALYSPFAVFNGLGDVAFPWRLHDMYAVEMAMLILVLWSVGICTVAIVTTIRSRARDGATPDGIILRTLGLVGGPLAVGVGVVPSFAWLVAAVVLGPLVLGIPVWRHVQRVEYANRGPESASSTVEGSGWDGVPLGWIGVRAAICVGITVMVQGCVALVGGGSLSTMTWEGLGGPDSFRWGLMAAEVFMLGCGAVVLLTVISPWLRRQRQMTVAGVLMVGALATAGGISAFKIFINESFSSSVSLSAVVPVDQTVGGGWVHVAGNQRPFALVRRADQLAIARFGDAPRSNRVTLESRRCVDEGLDSRYVEPLRFAPVRGTDVAISAPLQLAPKLLAPHIYLSVIEDGRCRRVGLLDSGVEIEAPREGTPTRSLDLPTSMRPKTLVDWSDIESFQKGCIAPLKPTSREVSRGIDLSHLEGACCRVGLRILDRMNYNYFAGAKAEKRARALRVCLQEAGLDVSPVFRAPRGGWGVGMGRVREFLRSDAMLCEDRVIESRVIRIPNEDPWEYHATVLSEGADNSGEPDESVGNGPILSAADVRAARASS